MTRDYPSINYKFNDLCTFALDHFVNDNDNHIVYIEMEINNEFKDILWISPETISICGFGLPVELQIIGVDLV